MHNMNYELRILLAFVLAFPNARTTSYGIETVTYVGGKLWSTLPHSIKESQSLTAFFKKELKNYATESDCRLCKIFISGLIRFFFSLYFL